MASIVKSLRAISDPTRLRLLLLATGRGTDGGRAAGDSRDGPVENLGQPRFAQAGGDRRAIVALGRTFSIRFVRRRFPRFVRFLTRRGASFRKPPTTALRWILRCASARTRRPSISTSWLENSDALTFRADPGRLWPTRCCGFCRQWSLRISARARARCRNLLARSAKKVIAIDNSEKMVEFGANLAREHGCQESRVSSRRYRRSADRAAKALIWRSSARRFIMPRVRRKR